MEPRMIPENTREARAENVRRASARTLAYVLTLSQSSVPLPELGALLDMLAVYALDLVGVGVAPADYDAPIIRAADALAHARCRLTAADPRYTPVAVALHIAAYALSREGGAASCPSDQLLTELLGRPTPAAKSSRSRSRQMSSHTGDGPKRNGSSTRQPQRCSTGTAPRPFSTRSTPKSMAACFSAVPRRTSGSVATQPSTPKPTGASNGSDRASGTPT